MEKLLAYSNVLRKKTSLEYKRDEISIFPWEVTLLGIIGSRGVGKTTLFLQHMITNYKENEALYISLDDIYFSEHNLIGVARQFVRNGGKRLYIDEVHKYPNWSIEIKNLYDVYGPDLKIAYTGSSMSYVQSGNADLSRRAIIRHMQGLSFRQFINLKMKKDRRDSIHLKRYTLEEILNHTYDILHEISETGLNIYPLFQEYLQYGYYPFFIDDKDYFTERLNATVRAVLEADFAQLHNVTLTNIRSIYKLLFAIATSPPFQPNIDRLSKRVGISRKTLLEYLHHLDRADILILLKDPQKGMSILKKPDKVYLDNSNLLYNFEPKSVQIGTVRETFVVNQLKNDHEVHYPKNGDVLVDEKYTFEIGGKKKSKKQIKEIKHSFILSDDLDIRVGNKLPIWLTGMMY